MKILLAQHDLAQYGGTQSWMYEMARVLTGRGHEVGVMCFVGGVMEERMKPHVAKWHVNRYPDDDYELALINQVRPMQVLASHKAFKIYTQHGPFHAAEQYPGGADAVVAVTEEVRLHLARRGHDAKVISNGVDLERFMPGSSDRNIDVLNLCKGARGRQMVEDACAALGLTWANLHYKDSPQGDVAPFMQDASVVVGYGRTIIEAMACGSSPLSFDARGREEPRGDGVIVENLVDIFARHGFNGRASLRFYDQGLLQADIYRASRVKAGWGWRSSWVVDHADVEAKVDAYLELSGLAGSMPTHLVGGKLKVSPGRLQEPF